MNPSPLFKITDLKYCYRDKSGEHTALDFKGCNFTIPKGKKTVLLGPSGCGKTTLLQILGLLRDIQSNQGAVVLNGDAEYSNLTDNKKIELRGKQFGFILQSFYLLPNFTALQNIAMPLMFQGFSRNDALDKAKEFIAGSKLSGSDENDLMQSMQKTSDKLSQGQKQRAAILRALIHDPSVIFADELTSNLDVNSVAKTFDLIEKWLQGAKPEDPRTFVMVTHDLKVALKTGDYFVVINEKHNLAMTFERKDYEEKKEELNQILDHQPGTGGIDEK